MFLPSSEIVLNVCGGINNRELITLSEKWRAESVFLN